MRSALCYKGTKSGRPGSDAYPVIVRPDLPCTRKAADYEMVALVERMLDVHQKLAAATTPADKKLYQRQIEATDAEIDALVYELYGLTEEEIAIVEGRHH